MIERRRSLSLWNSSWPVCLCNFCPGEGRPSLSLWSAVSFLRRIWRPDMSLAMLKKMLLSLSLSLSLSALISHHYQG